MQFRFNYQIMRCPEKGESAEGQFPSAGRMRNVEGTNDETWLAWKTCPNLLQMTQKTTLERAFLHLTTPAENPLKNLQSTRFPALLLRPWKTPGSPNILTLPRDLISLSWTWNSTLIAQVNKDIKSIKLFHLNHHNSCHTLLHPLELSAKEERILSLGKVAN